MMVLAASFVSCAKEKKEANKDMATTAKTKVEAVKDIRIIISTSKGDMHLTIFASKVPVTAANFLNLAKRGYYNGLKFHRVIPNFMIQGGDPKGTGTGGPGYSFRDETRKDLKHDGKGVLSMANSDNPRVKKPYQNLGNTNGSQFFITHKATPWLDGMHTVFGKVTQGLDVVDAIQKGDTIKSIKILDSTDALFSAQKKNLSKWNSILNANQ